jgi:predicted enzyme related to lactoylglutathione lyase
MSIRIQCLCIDTTDPARLASFWEAALGWRRTYGAEDGMVPDLLFLGVPQDKAGKNRLHLDLRPDDQGAEVARLERLGARRVDIGQGPDASWVVMADPAGNEFCVLRALTAAELDRAGQPKLDRGRNSGRDQCRMAGTAGLARRRCPSDW